jgi:hypothetical protein
LGFLGFFYAWCFIQHCLSYCPLFYLFIRITTSVHLHTFLKINIAINPTNWKWQYNWIQTTSKYCKRMYYTKKVNLNVFLLYQNIIIPVFFHMNSLLFNIKWHDIRANISLDGSEVIVILSEILKFDHLEQSHAMEHYLYND